MPTREAALAALNERIAHAIADDNLAALLAAEAQRDAQAVAAATDPESDLDARTCQLTVRQLAIESKFPD